MSDPSYVVVTPVRNEGQRIGQTIRSMESQTLLPEIWVIVDDGSTDETPGQIRAAAAKHAWIRVVHRPDRGSRKPGGGVVEAVYDGFSHLAGLSWQFLVKLDGDLSFEPDYFEQCLKKFAEEPRLGIAGGTVCFSSAGELHEESVGDPAFHVRGATKIYRQECWADIGGLVRAPGWDTVDEVKANMKGWRTRTFADLRILQHKTTGSADGSWKNWYKNGKGCSVAGYDPIFMLAKCARRALQWPPLVPAVALGAGFWAGYWGPLSHLRDKEVSQYLRGQQWRRLLGRPSIYG